MWLPVVVGAAVGAVVGLVISKNKRDQETKKSSNVKNVKTNVSSNTNTTRSTASEKYELGKAHMYYGYKRGVTVNYHKAYELLKEAAALNHVGALIELGNLCKSGNLGKCRYVEAKQWYEKAANKGNALGICKLGYMYHYGLGTLNDKVKAKELYELAAQKGNKEAKYRLLYLK